MNLVYIILSCTSAYFYESNSSLIDSIASWISNLIVGYESMTFSLFNNKTSLQTIILYIMIIATFIFAHRLTYIDIALPLLDAFRLAR
jgi:hypothetical protein